eukprot:SAG25_NODE_7112_length_503_cov_1.358911_2_plen_29_part_01
MLGVVFACVVVGAERVCLRLNSFIYNILC